MRTRNQRGVSVIELTVVAAMGIALFVQAVPNMMNAIGNARLRGAATSLSGIMQQSRIVAIKVNRSQTLRFSYENGGPYAYSKDATSASTNMSNMDAQVQLGSPILQSSTPTGSVPALDDTTLGFTPLTYPDVVSFNAQGIPCKYVSGSCTISGFIYYFNDPHRNGWTAVSISPAGRIKQWFWNGSVWGN